MLRAALVLALVLMLAPSLRGHARAGETWAADDPIVSIDGRLLDIQVQMPASQLSTMRSTTVTVLIPQNLSGQVVVDGVSAFPMQTSIVPRGKPWNGTGPIPLEVIVEVDAASDYPVRVAVTPLLNLTTPSASATTVTGTANSRIVVPVLLGR